MSVMGKKYPATPEEFHQQIKDETIDFDPEQAGKRMKVPVPVTWDRELSFKNASKKQIWTGLLTKNQVPYMALLRNLRNILKADLEVPILKKVI
jgi:telomerase protein component 1